MTVPALTPRPQGHDIRPVMPFRRRTPSCPALRVSVLTKQYPVPRTSIDCGMNFYGPHYIVSAGALSRWHCDKKDRDFLCMRQNFCIVFYGLCTKRYPTNTAKAGGVSAPPPSPVILPILPPSGSAYRPTDAARSSGQPPQSLRHLNTPARSSPGSPASATASGRCSGHLWGSRTSPPPGTGRSSCAVR